MQPNVIFNLILFGNLSGLCIVHFFEIEMQILTYTYAHLSPHKRIYMKEF
jgi:hypothetical protein